MQIPVTAEEAQALQEKLTYKAWKARRASLLRGKLTDDVLRELERLGAHGFTTETVRQFYGIEVLPWMDLWKTRPNHLANILETGRQKKIDMAAAQLLTHVQQGKLGAIMFYLKTVGKWREMDKLVDIEKPPSFLPAISLTINDPQEAAKIYQKVMTET